MCHQSEDVAGYNVPAEQQLEFAGSGQTIPAYAYGYKQGEPQPTVIVLHDIFGANKFYRDMGQRLAEAGFAAILPDLFVRQGPLAQNSPQAAFARSGQHSFPVALEDIRAIVDKLSSEGRNVGFIGFCMGGTLALLADARIPQLKAAVVYYGFPVNAHPTPNRPFNPIDEVSQLHAPILGFWGEEDMGVGPDNVRAYVAAAKQAGKSIDATIYPGVGHGFMTFSSEGPAAKPSEESWVRAIQFLKERLG
ncbi:MAG TPA: dienelactone hydrolase family protein [Ktedonobacteraceae bacterium]|nr:dienelactone hydrolase family protein [Ktedonobacteraceae bacterium]